MRLPLTSVADAQVTHCTLRRFCRVARELRFAYTDEDLTPVGVAPLCERVEAALRDAHLTRQRAAVARWKERLRHSALHSGKEVFAHLRSVTLAAHSNSLAGPDGAPAYHPAVALAHAADQWNTVFEVHAEDFPVDPLMRPVQHLLEQRASLLVLDPVSAEELAASIVRRSPDSSAGLVGGGLLSSALCLSLCSGSSLTCFSRWSSAGGPCRAYSALLAWLFLTKVLAPPLFPRGS